MHKKYQEVFQALADAAIFSAEIALKHEKTKENKQRIDTANEMHEKYLALNNKIQAAGEEYIPTKDDIALLLIASIIVSKQLENQVENTRKAIAGYQTDIIPKLQQILNECENDSEVASKSEQMFIINDNE